MSETIDFYQQQARHVFSDLPWLLQLQQQALADFARLSFPTRADEEWKYTPTDAFLKQRFTMPGVIAAFTAHDVIPAQAANYPATAWDGELEVDSRLRGNDTTGSRNDTTGSGNDAIGLGNDTTFTAHDVIPAQAGNYSATARDGELEVDSRLRGNDTRGSGNDTTGSGNDTIGSRNGTIVLENENFGYHLSLIDGILSNDNTNTFLPPGVIVLPLAEAFVKHSELVQAHLGQILQHEHGFHALNTAMLQFGLFIYLPKNTQLTEPLVLSHYQTNDKQAVYLRHLIVAEAGSSASIIEDYQGDAVCYFTNTITEVATGADAKIAHYKIQRESKHAFHVGHTFVKQAARSQFESHLFHFGGAWSRSDLTIHLQEPKAHCLMNGIYAPGDGQHMDQHTLVNHLVPNCSSEQNYKGILNGSSRAVFNGKVMVAKHAQHTEAKQQNKNLLLSATAEVNTKPQLDIYADDVTCTHGATVGQLDEEALFYLATRGIDRTEASQYLIHAFAIENLRLIHDKKLAISLEARLMEQIG